VTAEQQTRIRETVFSGSNVPRVDRVNFSLRVGTAIPASVRIVEVPSVLIDIHPEWRGHSYFVTGDDIVICDSSRNIVAMVPVGSSNARTGQGGSGSGVVADLSVDEIREVQLVLMREGFSVEADGRFGPRTREALIQFQRRNGLQANGQIDSRTITSLGVNIRGSGDSTTGQGRSQPGGGNAPGGNDQPSGGNNPPSGNNNPPNNNTPAGNNPGNNPPADGSNRGGMNQPNAGGNNQRGTTGQGGMPTNPNTSNPDNNATPGNMPNNPSGNTPSNQGGNMPNTPGNRPNSPNNGAGAR
jgi:peptidoglycan hydrolase-like protein with peptidoglycan-binding domain